MTRVWRRGKHLVFDLSRAGSAEHLVINPMLGGRLQIETAGKPPGSWVFALDLDDGGRLRYLDMRDMGRVHLVQSLSEVPAWDELGPEADAIGDAGLDAFRQRLRRFRDELKDLLRNQRFLAGIGNAYSDEILFRARLLPLRRRASLESEQEAALFEAIPAVLHEAVENILANPAYLEEKQDRSFMSVHGRGGGTCPRCGHRISQVGPDRSPLNFCRGCQV
jgi:formamidopyrimidine-DNA glycosylase